MSRHQPASASQTPARVAYLRGQRYREELLATGRHVLREVRRTTLRQAVRLLPFSTSDPNARVADALAREYGTDRRTIQADARYSAAVDTIILTCGEQAREVILGGQPLLSRKTTEQISRTAPPRQHYEMEQVSNGHRPLRGAAPIFDTLDFKEVVSRLRRAEGKVRVGLRVFQDTQATVPLNRQDRDTLSNHARTIIEATHELARLVRAAPEDRTGECDDQSARQQTRRGPGERTARSGPDRQGVVGRLAQAAGFLRKCVRDLPILLRELSPLQREKQEIEGRAMRIVSDSSTILQVACGPGTA